VTPCHENTSKFSFLCSNLGYGCGLRVDRLESDCKAEALKALNVAIGSAADILRVVVSLTEIAERSSCGQHVIDGDGNLMSDGKGSATAASATFQSMVGGFEEGAVAMRGGGGRVARAQQPAGGATPRCRRRSR